MLFLHPRYWCARALLRLALLIACASVALSTEAAADSFTQRDTFGEAGLLDMPSARMAPDGEIALTFAGLDNVGRGTLSFQILPWLEGSFRYTRIGRWAHSPDYDRSFGLKLRLFEEGAYTPDISVGLRDIVGTGIYGGEYIAATKRILDFDVTAGLGWGRLASNGTFENPLAQMFSSFETRTRNSTLGGQVDFGSFFHGPDMGAFGGVVWHTPIENLNLTLEYSSDRYVQERVFGGFKGTSPVNVGLTYQPVSGVTFTAGWFYGYSFGAGLTLSANPSEPSTAGKIGVAPMPVNVRGDAQRAEAVADFVARENVVQHMGGGISEAAYTISGDTKVTPARFDASAAEAKIRTDAKAQGLRIEALAISPQELTLYYTNRRYAFESEAIGRLTRVLLADAPPSVEAFHLVPVVSGVPAQDIYLLRAPLERMFDARGSPSEIGAAISLSAPPLDNPALADSQSASYPRFSWAVSPSLRQGLFDPQSPYRIQAFLAMSGAVEFAPGLSLEGAFEANIYNTFTTKRASNSVLPHVRSDLAEYLTKGENGIASLDAVWRARAAPDVFVEAKAGYLESMFAGAGAQILWRPEGERWALGADIYEVWQRDFDRLFGLQHYHVLTGHVSLYYRSPWHGIGVNLHAGRYLAGDYGATIEVTRRFATGVEIGAFATFTNVPFAKFGEGSFDKGIMISIPLEWALPLSTQSSYNLTLRPLTRDGGQRLDGDDSLYGETQRTSYGEITEHEDAIANP